MDIKLPLLIFITPGESRTLNYLYLDFADFQSIKNNVKLLVWCRNEEARKSFQKAKMVYQKLTQIRKYTHKSIKTNKITETLRSPEGGLPNKADLNATSIQNC